MSKLGRERDIIDERDQVRLQIMLDPIHKENGR
jgi:hypothetical protein